MKFSFNDLVIFYYLFGGIFCILSAVYSAMYDLFSNKNYGLLYNLLAVVLFLLLFPFISVYMFKKVLFK